MAHNMMYVEVGIYVDTENLEDAERTVEHVLSLSYLIDSTRTEWIDTHPVRIEHVE